MTDADAVAQLFEDLGESVDIVINNAAIYEESKFLDSTFEDWQRIWRDNRCKSGRPGQRHIPRGAKYGEARRRRYVCVSSRGAFRGEPTAPAYGASKAGLNQLSQSAAKALAPSNVVVGVVAPGFVDTAMAAEALAGERGDAIRGDVRSTGSRASRRSPRRRFLLIPAREVELRRDHRRERRAI